MRLAGSVFFCAFLSLGGEITGDKDGMTAGKSSIEFDNGVLKIVYLSIEILQCVQRLE